MTYDSHDKNSWSYFINSPYMCYKHLYTNSIAKICAHCRFVPFRREHLYELFFKQLLVPTLLRAMALDGNIYQSLARGCELVCLVRIENGMGHVCEIWTFDSRISNRDKWVVTRINKCYRSTYICIYICNKIYSVTSDLPTYCSLAYIGQKVN